MIKTTHGAAAQGELDLVEVGHGAPALGDETLLGDVQVEHVERVVDGLDLTHLDEPHLDVLSSRHQHAVTVVLGLTEHLSTRKASVTNVKRSPLLQPPAGSPHHRPIKMYHFSRLKLVP